MIFQSSERDSTFDFDHFDLVSTCLYIILRFFFNLPLAALEKSVQDLATCARVNTGADRGH
jgi:hypothetical protein